MNLEKVGQNCNRQGNFYALNPSSGYTLSEGRAIGLLVRGFLFMGTVAFWVTHSLRKRFILYQSSVQGSLPKHTKWSVADNADVRSGDSNSSHPL